MHEATERTNALIKMNRLEKKFAWFLLAFLIGLILRLVLLNKMVYAQNELVLVNQALRISQRMVAQTSSVPVYTGLTGWLFFLFGPGNFLARFLPALVGASLVLLPWVWKEQIGQKASLILSFALAFDPTFLLFSRAIHGGIFAIAGLLWAFTSLKKNKPLLAGISMSFAFLSGPSFWSFLLIIGLTLLVLKIIRPGQADNLVTLNFENRNITWGWVAAGFVVSCVLILSSLLLDPSGLGGMAAGIVAFIKDFAQPFEKPIYHLIYLYIAYSLLPLTLFLVASFRFRSSDQGDWFRIGGISILISLLIGMIISRESFEILLLPVLISWIGGAIWLGQWQFNLKESSLSTVLLMGFVLAVFTYLSVNIGRLSNMPRGTPQFWNIFLMIVAGVILLISAWWLVKFGWSSGKGNKVFLLTFLFILTISSLSDSMRSLYSNQQIRSLEYLDNQVVLPNNDVEAILNDFALTGRYLPQAGGFNLTDLPEEFSWYLRDFSIEQDKGLPSMILTRSSTLPDQSLEYRGINVVLLRSIDWQTEAISSYLQAFAGKIPEFQDQKGVLWVLTNLFTGASQ